MHVTVLHLDLRNGFWAAIYSFAIIYIFKILFIKDIILVSAATNTHAFHYNKLNVVVKLLFYSFGEIN